MKLMEKISEIRFDIIIAVVLMGLTIVASIMIAWGLYLFTQT